MGHRAQAQGSQQGHRSHHVPWRAMRGPLRPGALISVSLGGMGPGAMTLPGTQPRGKTAPRGWEIARGGLTALCAHRVLKSSFCLLLFW